MASFEEIKKRVKKYGVSGEAESADKEYQTDNAGDNGYKSSNAIQRIKESVKSNSISFDITSEDINSFFNDASNFLKSAQEDYDKVGWLNASSAYNARQETYKDLFERSQYVRAYINANKDKFSEEDYNKFISFLDDYRKGSYDVINAYDSAKKYYSQWETEDAYNNYLTVTNVGKMSSSQIKDKYLSDDKKKNEIAYTTGDGKNITWQDLYDTKFADEDLATRYSDYSSRPDWEANSYGIENSEDTRSDYDIIWELSHTQIPYDREMALKQGHNEEDINDIFEKREYISKKYGVDLSDIYNNVNVFNDLMSQLKDNAGELDTFDHMPSMTEEELQVLNYIYHTEGRAAALEWHNSRKAIYQQRAYDLNVTNLSRIGKDNPFWASVGSVALNMAAGGEYISDLFNYWATGEEQVNTLASSASAIRSGVSEGTDWMIGNWDAFDFVYNTGMSMADSVASQALFGKFGGVVQGLSAAAQTFDDAKRRGLSDDKAFWNGLAAGVFEGLFETWSISKLKALKGGATRTVKDYAKELAKSMLTNATEETATEIANIAYDKIINGDFSNYETTIRQYVNSGMSEKEARKQAFVDTVVQVAESGASGALMGLGFGAYGGGVSYLRTNAQASQHGNNIIDIGGADALKQLAYEMSGDKKSPNAKEIVRLTNNAENKATAKNIGRLSLAMEEAVSTQNIADIKNALQEKGLSKRDANKAAEILNKVANGYELTEAEAAEIAGSQNIIDVLHEVVENRGSTPNTRTKNLALARLGFNTNTPVAPNAMADVDSVLVSESAPQDTEAVKANISSTESETPTTAEILIHYDGKTRLIEDNNEVSIKEIASIKDGVVSVRLEDGREVDKNDVHFGNKDEGLVYEAVADLGVDVDTANAIVQTAMDKVKGINKNGTIDVGVFVEAIRDSYLYGNKGFSANELVISKKTNVLPAELSKQVYNQGKIKAVMESKQAQKVFNDTKAKVKEAQKAVKDGDQSTERTGRVKLHNMDESTLTEKQSDQIKAVERIAKVFTKSEFTFFASYVNNEGKRVYKDADGKIKHAPSGKFYADGRIWIDINAGNMGNGLILFTAAHELTHFAKQFSPEQYKLFTDFLMEEYGKFTVNGKKVSVDMLVERQIAKAKSNGRDITYDVAFDEVIADSCERFLVDGNALKKLDALEAKDKGLVAQIKSFIRNLVKKIKKWYAGLNPDSLEANLVSRMDKTAYNKLISMWESMLSDAGDTYQTIMSATNPAETLNAAGIEVDANKGSATMMSVRYAPTTDAEVNKVAKALAESVGVSFVKAKAWVKSETSLASIILDPSKSAYLDYEADNRYEMIKKNADYPQGTVDASNLCKKRQEFTALYDRLQKEFPNKIISATDLEKIRQILIEEGVEVACALCYVEERRQLLGEIAQGFIDGYKNGTLKANISKEIDAQDTYVPTIYDLITYDGYRSLTIEHPSIAQAFKKFNNARGMQAGRLVEGKAEYKREILSWNKKKVDFVNSVGGLRIFSFSDFEAHHLIDIVQIIQDCAVKGVMIQGYTKVPAFANAVKDTNVKINRSLIAKGTGVKIENGKKVLDLDPVEGINFNDKDFFDSTDSENVGNVLVGMGDEQVKLAMTSPLVDYIIPFHTGLKKDILKQKKIDGWFNYKDFQTDKEFHAEKVQYKKDGSIKNDGWTVAENQINIYTDVLQAAEAEGKPIKNKVEFVNKFLAVAKEKGLKPRFWNFLKTDANGDYVYTEGYHKFLVDFKLFDKNGKILPQKPVVPVFDDALNARILNEYVEDKKNPVTRDKVYQRLVDEVIKGDSKERLSDRDSEGNTLTAEQQEFFKNSKVRDEQGRLIVVYHGTETGGFTVFSNSHSGEGYWFADKTTAESYIDVSSIGEEDWTGGLTSLYRVYLNAKNPLVVDAKGYRAAYMPTDDIPQINGGKFEHIDNIAVYAKENGYDGLIVKNVKDYGMYTEENLGEAYDYNLPEGTVYVVFNSNQVKNTNNLKPTANEDIRYSDRGYAPTFYSQMGKVVEGMKQEKFGASSVVSMLRGRGVKAEEVRWSGIATWLEGKKSVTKQELLDFIAGSQLQIGEQMSGSDIDLRYDASNRSYTLYDDYGQVVDTYDYNEFLGGYVSDFDEEIYSNAIELEEALREEYGGIFAPRWSQYKLNGGENYREIVFTMPNSTYTNRAMKGHWGQDAEGVLAHARIQDFIVNGKKMLFIEEIQSDWHNEGHRTGYSTKEYEDAVESHNKLYSEYKKLDLAFHKYIRSNEFMTDPEDVRKKKHDWLRGKVDAAQKKYREASKFIESLEEKGAGSTPDAPFKDNYHEYVLKRLLRMAAEEGYDSIGWTTADIQSKRWSEDYAEGYRIEYDQDMPKFLKKYGRQWGATVGYSYVRTSDVDSSYFDEQIAEIENDIEQYKADLSDDNTDEYNAFIQEGISDLQNKLQVLYKNSKGEKVWSMEFTDSMKDTVLNEGQVLYSDRVTDKGTLDFLENQEHVTVYRAMQLIDGKLYPPMNAYTYDENGKKILMPHSEIGAWEQSVERPDLIDKKTGKFKLDKGKVDGGKRGTTVPAAYNPYIHTSLSMLNDQFTSAYTRSNLVVVKGVVPKSELTSGYKAQYAKDAVGETEWHSGVVSSQLPESRKVILSRWFKPVEIMDNDVVAKNIKEMLGNTGIEIPYNVVSPSLRRSLEKIGVPIGEGRGIRNLPKKDEVKYSDKENTIKKDPISLTEQDLRGLLQKVKEGKLEDGTYIPVRRNTPDALLYAIKVVAKRKGNFDTDVLDKIAVDRPIAMQVQKARQALATLEEWQENGKPHNLTIDDVVTIVKKMDTPQYIVYELSTDRYVEVIKYQSANGSKAFAVVELDNFKGEQYLNGYKGGIYNILVTMYQPDAIERVNKLLKNKDNIVIHIEKMKGNSQFTSDIHVSSVLNKSPFADTVSQKPAFVNQETKNSDIKLSDRDTDSMSNRSLLANALESAVKNDIERNKLAQYKQKIDLINSEEQKLHDIREEIKNLSFAKGRRDVEKIKSLQFEAKQTANRINTYDRQLLSLEASKPLKDVLEREKQLAYKKAEKIGKDAVARQREKAAQTTRELMTRYQESRSRATERRHQTELRHKIKKVVGELNQLLLRPTKDKHIKEELRMAVAEALSVINMDTVGAKERIAKLEAEIARATDQVIIDELTASRDRIKHMGENLKDKLTALQTAYEKIKNSEDVEIVNAYQEPILNTIKAVVEEVGDTPMRYMSLKQLESVYEMYSMVLHAVRTANKMFKSQKYETLVQTAEAVNEEVRKVGGEHYKRSVLGSALRKIGWTFLKPMVAFRTIGSETFTGLYNNLRAGEDTYYVDIKEAQDFIQEQYKKHNFKNWNMKETKDFIAKSGKPFKLNLEQIMSLYAYSRREQALDHIIEGGIVFEDSVITEKKHGIPVKYEVTTKEAFNLSESTFAEIINSLTAEQKAFVEEMQAYLSDTMGAKGNEVSMALLGVKLFKEKFYFPLKSSQFYMNFKPEEAGEIKLKNPAFSKETVQHANNPVVLSNFTDVWANHVNDMSMYHSFVLQLEDFTRVFNYKTKTAANVETMATEATIATAYGKGATQYIRNFLKSLNGGVRVQGTVADKFISLTKKGAVLASASVTIQQPSAIMRAMALINPKYFVKATPQSLDLVHHKRAWEEIKKYAPIAGIKEMGGYDIGIGQGTVEWIKGQNTLKDKVDDALGKAPAYMDEVTWVSIWNAVKKEVVTTNKDIAANSEAFLEKCGERFTEVISLTQVYDSVFSRSDIMRNANPLAKMLTSFMAEPTTTLNMLIDSFVQGKRTGNFGGFAKITASTGGAVVAATVFNSMLKAIVMAMRDDDEEESYAEKYVEHFVGDLKDNINPLNLIPFVKDIVSIFEGYDVERMDMALFSDLKNAIDAFDSDSKTDYEKWSGLIGAVSAFFGVPIKNVERDIRGLYNTIASFINGEKTTSAGIDIALREGWTGEEISNKQQLYEAIINGDTVQIDRVKNRFKDADTLKAAIRSAFKEHYLAGDLDYETTLNYLIEYGEMDEDEAYWKMQEWEHELENGDSEDYGKYNDFFDAVQTGKNLKSVIKEYTDNGVEAKTLAAQITSHFKPLYKEMSNYERASIKGYLLNAYALLGYDRAKKSKDIDKWLED